MADIAGEGLDITIIVLFIIDSCCMLNLQPLERSLVCVDIFRGHGGLQALLGESWAHYRCSYPQA